MKVVINIKDEYYPLIKFFADQEGQSIPKLAEDDLISVIATSVNCIDFSRIETSRGWAKLPKKLRLIAKKLYKEDHNESKREC